MGTEDKRGSLAVAKTGRDESKAWASGLGRSKSRVRMDIFLRRKMLTSA
jgi:hypothetical protein